MSDRLARVIGDVFNRSHESFSDDDGPNTIEEWDSMGHLNLVLALESEFGVTLSADDATNMLNIASIKMVLRERGVRDA